MNDDALFATAASLIVTGFAPAHLDDATRREIARAPFGGFVLFARNTPDPATTRILTDQLRELVDRPLIAIDAEGGRVARFAADAHDVPSAMAVGATQSVTCARQAGEAIGFDLARAGINVDFAPSLDLAVDPRNTVIGTRSFGEDPERVAECARAFAEGLEAFGVTAVYKHFPGHGNTHVDSHLALPSIASDANAFRNRDLVPFARVASDAAAMMTAHVVVPCVDPNLPATMSHALLTTLLRQELGFRGVCFTDCMQMRAIADGIGTIDGVVAAIVAGADCALVSHDAALAAQAARAIVNALRDGVLPIDRLEEASSRVAALRARASHAPSELYDVSYSVGRRIAARAVTAVRGIAHADPTSSIVVSFQSESDEGVVGSHRVHPSLVEQSPILSETTAPLDPAENDVARVLNDIRLSNRRPIVLARRAAASDAQRRAIDAIINLRHDTIVVAAREPYDVACFATAENVVVTYGDDAASIAGLADVLFGDGRASGTLPVTL